MKNRANKKSQASDRTAAEASMYMSGEDQIRCRAYELYEARGCGEGHDLEDWLQAEAEITGRARRATA